MNVPQILPAGILKKIILCTGVAVLFCNSSNAQFQELERMINREINNVFQPTNYRTGTQNNYHNTNRNNYNNYQQRDGQYNSRDGMADVYNDDEYLFIDDGTKSRYIDSKSAEFAKATRRNILTKNEDEDEYLKELIYFSANNKLNNKSLHRCRYKTIKYTVARRDSTTLPSVVDAIYEYKEAPEVFCQMRIFLSAGLPYRIHYGNENLWPRRIDEAGVLGSLYFTYDDGGRILQLESKLVKELSAYNKTTVYPRINDSLTKLVKTKFPGTDCSKCLVRSVTPDTRTYQIETTDAFGHKTYDYKSATSYHISIKNKCDKPLKVIGVWQSNRYPGAREYKLVFKNYKPRQELEWDIDYSPTLFDHHEVDLDDIDLKQINKSFNYTGDEYQWLRVIQN